MAETFAQISVQVLGQNEKYVSSTYAKKGSNFQIAHIDLVDVDINYFRNETNEKLKIRSLF